MTEEWREVAGTDGRYEVSSLGRFRKRLIKRGPVVMNGYRTKHGYFVVSMDNRQYLRHVLVARAFHGDPAPGLVVRHLNGTPGDDRVENLRWGTPKENAEDSKRHGTNYALNKTHCKWGHEFTAENTFIDNLDRRICRTCKARHMRATVRKVSEARRLARIARQSA